MRLVQGRNAKKTFPPEALSGAVGIWDGFGA